MLISLYFLFNLSYIFIKFTTNYIIIKLLFNLLLKMSSVIDQISYDRTLTLLVNCIVSTIRT